MYFKYNPRTPILVLWYGTIQVSYIHIYVRTYSSRIPRMRTTDQTGILFSFKSNHESRIDSSPFEPPNGVDGICDSAWNQSRDGPGCDHERIVDRDPPTTTELFATQGGRWDSHPRNSAPSHATTQGGDSSEKEILRHELLVCLVVCV